MQALHVYQKKDINSSYFENNVILVGYHSLQVYLHSQISEILVLGALERLRSFCVTGLTVQWPLLFGYHNVVRYQIPHILIY